MTEFSGFPKETPRFLAALADHNTRDWFRAHREDYEAHWVEPARRFVVAAGAALAEIAPAIEAEPRIDGSIFRVNRDIRFSNDKRPYKDHLDFWFWEGDRRDAVSGFYIRITPNELGIGAGAHRFDKERLAVFRDALADDARCAGLAAAVAAVEKEGWPVLGEAYRRLPRGYEAADAVTERFLRYAGLWCSKEAPIPASLHDRRLIGYAMRRWRKLAPLHRWLVDTVQ